ncbi:hypothetical protein M422DRAFT_69147 [Sphaerobolus stellatus SS14]|uniref:F-box domain-containing protein n=1 Tax=Sphaerobolus stellatus (strain SS14) TaxID=990650 RepID=A0A0C9VL51_SPHS4|nr:hypothetical protein M422DRAFT_69147 [Sphaerobolus stellatus SS14]
MDSISQIPQEILEQILYLSLPPLFQGQQGPLNPHTPFVKDPFTYQQEFDATFPLTFGIARFRTTLRLVCKEWNSLILDSPKLWSRLEIRANEFIEPEDPDRLRIILGRSKTMDLEIKLQLAKRGRYDGASYERYWEILEEDYMKGTLKQSSNEDVTKVAKGIQSVISILRSESYRIRVLILYYTNYGYGIFTKDFFPRNISITMPRLEYLFGSFLEPHSFASGIEQVTGAIDAPRLRSCGLHVICGGIWVSITPSSLLNITSLSAVFDPTDFQKTLKLLAGCHGLKELSWGISPWNDWGNFASNGPPRISTDLKFPLLRSLHLKIDNNKEATSHLFNDVANSLHAPQLRSLTIEGGQHSTPVRWIGLFLRRNPQLHELCISLFHLQGCPEDLLSPLVELRTLILSQMEISNAFLQSIFSGSHLPSLNKFVIENPIPGWAVSRTLLRIIKDQIVQTTAARVQFHIWTDGHVYVNTLPWYSRIISRSVSTDQVERNYLELLELAEENPEIVQWYKWDRSWSPRWTRRFGEGLKEMTREMEKLAQG